MENAQTRMAELQQMEAELDEKVASIQMDSAIEEMSEKQYQRLAKDWRQEYFGNVPMNVVGDDDVRLAALRDQQNDPKKPALTTMQIEELKYRQTQQKLRKEARKAKNKRERNAKRRNRPGRK